uniref:Uncharacterized protein n=1 Tax=Anopheles farauti TaxID=69004 RepID=A0A182QDB3_9DIPT
MGKSKFPGKPSRLVNKKRVSVLSPAGLTLSDEDNQENGGQQAATLGNASAAAIAATSFAGTSPASTGAAVAASSTASMRTTANEKVSFPAQRKEQHSKASKSSVATGVTVPASSQPLETANGRRHGCDKAPITKPGLYALSDY